MVLELGDLAAVATIVGVAISVLKLLQSRSDRRTDAAIRDLDKQIDRRFNEFKEGVNHRFDDIRELVKWDRNGKR